MTTKVFIILLLLSTLAKSQFNVLGIKLNSGSNYLNNNKTYYPSTTQLTYIQKQKINNLSFTFFTEKQRENKMFTRFNIRFDYLNSYNYIENIDPIQKTKRKQIIFNKNLLFTPSIEFGKLLTVDNLQIRLGIGTSLNYNQNLKSSGTDFTYTTLNSFQNNKQLYENSKPKQLGAGVYILTGIYYSFKTKYVIGFELTNGINYMYTLNQDNLYIDNLDDAGNIISSKVTPSKSSTRQFYTNLMKPSLNFLYTRQSKQK
jgi:hypothetical protein